MWPLQHLKPAVFSISNFKFSFQKKLKDDQKSLCSQKPDGGKVSAEHNKTIVEIRHPLTVQIQPTLFVQIRTGRVLFFDAVISWKCVYVGISKEELWQKLIGFLFLLAKLEFCQFRTGKCLDSKQTKVTIWEIMSCIYFREYHPSRYKTI